MLILTFFCLINAQKENSKTKKHHLSKEKKKDIKESKPALCYVSEHDAQKTYEKEWVLFDSHDNEKEEKQSAELSILKYAKISNKSELKLTWSKFLESSYWTTSNRGQTLSRIRLAKGTFLWLHRWGLWDTADLDITWFRAPILTLRSQIFKCDNNITNKRAKVGFFIETHSSNCNCIVQARVRITSSN